MAKEQKLPVAELIAAARRAAADIHDHVRATLGDPEAPAEWSADRVCHYVIFGAHIDPDIGVGYVPLDKPVTKSGRRKIGRREAKVARLRQWLCDAFEAGADPKHLKRELEERQKHQAIALAVCPRELEPLLEHAMRHDLLLPDSGYLGGGYHHAAPDGSLMFGWEEELPCEGGVTDRYYYAPK